jgi:hypothetical protein
MKHINFITGVVVAYIRYVRVLAGYLGDLAGSGPKTYKNWGNGDLGGSFGLAQNFKRGKTIYIHQAKSSMS